MIYKHCPSIKRLIIICTAVLALVAISSPIYAQEFNYGQTYEITDTDAVIGDIVARNSEGQIVRANLESSSQLVGILSENTTTILYEQNEGSGSPVAFGGTTLVNVTTLNGEISAGDFIVASSIDGKGQKVTNPNGIVVGIALASFSENDGVELIVNDKTVRVGAIPANIQLRPVGNTQSGALTNFVDQISNLLFTSAQTPQQAEALFRYLAAALVAATSIAISFRAFGKNISNGIEAMGRNPLAKRQIQTAIFFNAGLILVISIGGIILSLAILRF